MTLSATAIAVTLITVASFTLLGLLRLAATPSAWKTIW